MTKVGIAFSGGGVAGSAHLGVLLALEEAGIQFHCMTGTSSGAIVAALYACGFTTHQIIEMVPQITEEYLDYDFHAFFRKMINRKTKLQGLVKGERLIQFLVDKTGETTMEQLPFPVAFMTTDLKSARPTVLTSKPLAKPSCDYDEVGNIRVADAVMASCCIPIVFQPVLFENRILVDGGLIDNCPIAVNKSLGADKVIAVDLISATPSPSEFESLFSIIGRVVTVNLVAQAKARIPKADLMLQPDVGQIGALDFTQSERCIDCGYNYTRARIDWILETLAMPKTNAILGNIDMTGEYESRVH